MFLWGKVFLWDKMFLWGKVFLLCLFFLFCISHGFPFHTTHGSSGTPYHHHSRICLYHSEGRAHPHVLCSRRRVPPSKRCGLMAAMSRGERGRVILVENSFFPYFSAE
ncbi:uncharacterized protein TM35_000054710 [Trypanosoma theileri]|uniref:Uncharacterized protein n=1 Tax=Trypanosoma theileri TaxID=67003 RepID=A0A1X0P4S7_9TRYP|nr:uncharacterized protein TM35_000054710 [Trypanosoma theileri]ORC91875.1 hypothetical protein TM35_000054710 [Trypanosoma theileri]